MLSILKDLGANSGETSSNNTPLRSQQSPQQPSSLKPSIEEHETRGAGNGEADSSPPTQVAAQPSWASVPRASTPAYARRDLHPILALDDSTFRNSPLDQLLDMYSPAKMAASEGGPDQKRRSSANCDADFGVGLVNNWRSAASTCCKPPDSSDPNATRLTCHLIRQTRHAGKGDQLLYGENVQLSFKDLSHNDARMPKEYFTQYVKTRHNQAHSKLKWSRGSFSGACKPDHSSGWNHDYFPGWNVNWHNAFESAPGPRLSSCDVWIEEPTLLVERGRRALVYDAE